MVKSCNNCGYKVSMAIAAARSLVLPSQVERQKGLDFCYYYRSPVDGNRMDGCPGWISYTQMDCEKNPPL